MATSRCNSSRSRTCPRSRVGSASSITARSRIRAASARISTAIRTCTAAGARLSRNACRSIETSRTIQFGATRVSSPPGPSPRRTACARRACRATHAWSRRTLRTIRASCAGGARRTRRATRAVTTAPETAPTDRLAKSRAPPLRWRGAAPTPHRAGAASAWGVGCAGGVSLMRGATRVRRRTTAAD